MATILEMLSKEIGVEGEPITPDEFRLFLQTQRAEAKQSDRDQRVSDIAEVMQEAATPKQLRLQELQQEINEIMESLELLLQVRDVYQMEMTEAEEIPSVEAVRTEFQRRLSDTQKEG